MMKATQRSATSTQALRRPASFVAFFMESGYGVGRSGATTRGPRVRSIERLGRDAEDGERVARKKTFHRIHIETRQVGAFQHVVELAHAANAGVNGGEGIVAPKEDLVPHSVFL